MDFLITVKRNVIIDMIMYMSEVFANSQCKTTISISHKVQKCHVQR